MELSEDERAKIRRLLKKQSKKIFSDDLVEEVINRVQDARKGAIKLKEWLILDILTWEDYFYNLNLIKFL